MPAFVSSREEARVDNAILHDYLTSDVVLGEPEIRSTDPLILIEANCTNDELDFGMQGSSGDYEEEGDQRDERDVNRDASRQRWPAIEHEGFDFRTSDVSGYVGKDGNDANEDADQEEEASQADDESTHNVED